MSEGCIAPLIQEMRLAVTWAVLFSGLVECVFIVAMWVLCFNCWRSSGGQGAPD